MVGIKGVTDIENVHNVYDFCKAFVLQSLRSEHFFESADKVLLSCMKVVEVYELKTGYFGGALSLFYSFRLRQFCSALLGLFRFVPNFVQFDQVVP